MRKGKCFGVLFKTLSSEAINNHILTGELYKALKDAKKLIAYEEELLQNASRNAGVSLGSQGDRKSA